MMAWYVALGGAAGSACRFLLGACLQQRWRSAFPVGTLLINISGSFVLGLLLRYTLGTPAISSGVRALLTTGFCGGYTTFSTFSYETASLLEEGDLRRAGAYAALSVAVALAGTFAGFAFARALLRAQRTF